MIHTHSLGPLLIIVISLIIIRNPCPHNGLIVRIFKDLLRPFIGRQVCVRPSGGRTGDRGRGDNQGRAILHGLGEGNEKIDGRYDWRSSRRGALGLGHPCRSDSLLGSRDLSRNRSGFPNNNPFSLGTFLSRNRLGWRD